MKNKQWAVLILILSFLLSLFGCKKHVLDGPGMINPASWDSFTVSRTDSYAQYNFYIKVEQRNEGLFVTGEVRGEDGEFYIEEEGILLSKAVANKLYELQPALLEDCRQSSGENPGETFLPDDMIVLDQPLVDLEVICTDGRVLQKVDQDDFSIKVYQIVVSSFEKKYN